MTNESGLDRLIRAIVAVVAFVLAFTLVGPKSVVGIILIVVGAIMGLTAAVGFCPLYRIFGINTCKVK